MQPVFGPPSSNWNHYIGAEYNTQHAPNPFLDLQQPTQPINMYINAVYYPNWVIYKDQPPSSLNFGMISHVFYAFASVSPDGTVGLTDEWADAQIEVDGVKGCLRSFAALKRIRENSHVKVIISVGGGTGSANFAAVAHDPHKRQVFATTARALVDEYELDGIDIDWEHPSDPQQGGDYISLLHALRSTLPQPRYLLTSALPAGEWALKNINLAHASTYLDLINIMTYDFTGPWTETSGHQAQLFSTHSHNPHSCDVGVGYMLNQGVPPSKLLLGIPVYGRSFLGCHSAGHAYNGAGGEEGTFEYKDLPRPGTEEHVDMASCAAFCIGGDGGFVTYDNPQTVQMKAAYAKGKGLAGLFYWTATGDAQGKRSLVHTGYSALHM